MAAYAAKAAAGVALSGGRAGTCLGEVRMLLEAGERAEFARFLHKPVCGVIDTAANRIDPPGENVPSSSRDTAVGREMNEGCEGNSVRGNAS
jgi:hypothetical protein